MSRTPLEQANLDLVLAMFAQVLNPMDSGAVDRFIAEHETVFVIEQNRDAQLRMMLVNEQEIDPARLEPILHYDGTPITARFIIDAIATRVRADNVAPIAAKKGLAA